MMGANPGKFAMLAAGQAVKAPASAAVGEVTTLAQFYAAVLPHTGFHVVTRLPGAQQTFFQSQSEMIENIRSTPDHVGVYHAMATFYEATNRTQANAQWVRSFYLDIDAGDKKHAKHPAGTYPTQADARDALATWCKTTGLTPTFTLSSGEGLHVYFALTEDITPEAWKPTAENLKRLCVEHGLKADPVVTADVARILRPPGSKHKNGKTVTILESTGVLHDADEFAARAREQLAEPVALVPQHKWDLSINADVLDGRPKLADKRDRDPGLIAAGCQMVRVFAETGDPDRGAGDAVWRAMAGIGQHCSNGKKWFMWCSSKDARFNEREAAKKYDGWSAGPPTCNTIEGLGGDCTGCPNRGRITSPVQLGDSLDTDRQPAALAAIDGAFESGELRAALDQNGDANYLKTYQLNGRGCRDVYRAGTDAASDLLLGISVRNGGKVPSQQAVATAEALMRMKAKESGEVTHIALRVAKQDGVIFHDLGPGRIARIEADPDGTGWSVIEESPDTPVFRRGAGAGEMPAPERVGGPQQALQLLMGQYLNLFHLDKPRALVAVVLLLDALNCDTAHPVREYVGPGGSGKSTMAEHDVDLIDPSDSGRRTTNLKGDDLGAAAQQNFAVMVDNAGRVDKAIQDVLCVMSTGGTYMVRRFHKQSETLALRMHNPVFGTAVSPFCTQPDLTTRVIRFEMAARAGDSYVPEDEMREQMRASRPKMLGAMYTLLSAAMAALPTVRQRKQWPHRMVSFDQLGEAVVLAAGLKPGAFLHVIGEMRERMARRTASGDQFVIHLLAALRKFAAAPTDSAPATLGAILKRKLPLSVLAFNADRVQVTARPGALRDAMPKPIGFERDNAMPGSDRAFLDALRRVQPLLASMGIEYRERQHGTRPFVEFETSLESLNVD